MCVESDINHTIIRATLSFSHAHRTLCPCVLHFKFNAIELLLIFNKCFLNITVVEGMNELSAFSFGLDALHFYLILTIYLNFHGVG